MKVTYQGQKRSFRDIQLGVDAFSIDQFSGPWRDLSSVLKNHIVWSVLKSLVGFRGKFVQSEIDQNSAVERAIERLQKSKRKSTYHQLSVGEFGIRPTDRLSVPRSVLPTNKPTGQPFDRPTV